MTELPRWTIAELAARYTLEPTLEDVFVEGDFDCDVIAECFHKSKRTKKIVYSIQSVDIPFDVLSKHGFTEGNKQRVIVLALELADLPTECAFRCLVDSDLDHWFGTIKSVSRLIWTEYSSLEMYFFSDAILHDVMITLSRARIPDWKSFNDSLITTLSELYAFRLADRQFNLNFSWLSIDRCLTINEGVIHFNGTEYVDRLLNKNGNIGVKSEYCVAVQEWKKKFVGDPRRFIRGHDFLDFLAWAVRNYRGQKEFAVVGPIQRIFVLMAGNVPELQTLIP